MGLLISRMDLNFNILESFGYIEDKDVFKIVKIAKDNKFKLLSYVEPYENLFVNKLQLSYLQVEVEILGKNSSVNKVVLNNIQLAIEIEKRSSSGYLTFWAD